MVTDSQPLDTASTTYEGPDSLEKSMEHTEIDAKNEGMIIDQTAVLRETTFETANCLWAKGIEIPLQQVSSSQETTVIEVEEKWSQPKLSRNSEKLSRALTAVLRHNAVKLGLKIRPDGYIQVDDLLKSKQISQELGRMNVKDEPLKVLQDIVGNCQKQRFSLTQIDSSWYMRATQGHSMKEVASDSLLNNITLKDVHKYPKVVHGTYRKVMKPIIRQGLSRMRRNHVHFGTSDSFNGNLSGFRSNSELLVYLNLEKAIDEGLKFFISENNVILCPGDDKGLIPSKYFKYIKERVWKGGRACPGKVLWKPPILIHALIGNLPAKTEKSKKVKSFATSAFKVSDKSVFTRALAILCGHEISWISEQHGDRFNGQATGMERFVAFWWRAKGRASFSGKGAGAAKRWVLQELEEGPQTKESNKDGGKNPGLPSTAEESHGRFLSKKDRCSPGKKTQRRLSSKGAKRKRKTEGGRSKGKVRLNGDDDEIGIKVKSKKTNDEKQPAALTRLINSSGGCGLNKGMIRRSARIQSMAHRLETNGESKFLCAVCDLPIGQIVEENGVVKCAKCENMFHPACSGIQEGWLGHFKFQCSKLEIECRKHTNFTNQGINKEPGGSDSEMTDILSNNHENDSYRPDRRAIKCSLQGLPPPTKAKNNSGLTQEMQNLRISNCPTQVITPKNSKKLTMTIPGLNGISVSKKRKKNRDSPFSSFSADSSWLPCGDQNYRDPLESPETTSTPSEKKATQRADVLVPKDKKGLKKMKLIDRKDVRKTPKLFTVKNTEECSAKENLGDEQKAFKRVHNSRGTPPKNEELLSPVKISKASGNGRNSMRSDDSPPNKLLPAPLKPRPRSTPDGDSSQSLSLSKVIEFANSNRALNAIKSKNHKDVLFPVGDKILRREHQDLDEKELKRMKMVGTDSGISMDWSTKEEISTQNKDRNSNPGLSSELDGWVDVNDKNTDFCKRILGLPNLTTSMKESMKLVSYNNVGGRMLRKYLWHAKNTGKLVGGGAKDDATTEINVGLNIALVLMGLVKEALGGQVLQGRAEHNYTTQIPNAYQEFTDPLGRGKEISVLVRGERKRLRNSL